MRKALVQVKNQTFRETPYFGPVYNNCYSKSLDSAKKYPKNLTLCQIALVCKTSLHKYSRYSISDLKMVKIQISKFALCKGALYKDLLNLTTK